MYSTANTLRTTVDSCNCDHNHYACSVQVLATEAAGCTAQRPDRTLPYAVIKLTAYHQAVHIFDVPSSQYRLARAYCNQKGTASINRLHCDDACIHFCAAYNAFSLLLARCFSCSRLDLLTGTPCCLLAAVLPRTRLLQQSSDFSTLLLTLLMLCNDMRCPYSPGMPFEAILILLHGLKGIWCTIFAQCMPKHVWRQHWFGTDGWPSWSSVVGCNTDLLAFC